MISKVIGYIRDVLKEHKVRATQIAARFIAQLLMALAGAIGVTDPDATGGVGGVSQALAIGGIALAIYLLDLLVHKLRHGGVLKDAASTKGPR